MEHYLSGRNGGPPPPPHPPGDRLSRVEAKVDTLIGDVREFREEQASIVGVVSRLDAMAERWDEDRREIKDALKDLAEETRDSLVDTGEHAAQTAKEAAKHAADEVRLEHAREALAEAKEGGKWLRRFLAEKGVLVVAGLAGGGLALLMQRLFGGH